MASKNHLHTYKRSRSNRKIYRCSDPDCTHYVAKEFLEGKRAICGVCGESFILNSYALRLAVPHCETCDGRKLKMTIPEDTLLKTLENLTNLNLKD